ncbi:MAG: response regulator, partial [Desulfobacterales bacterium]|nr:response regulator [Desulfobacterales bacterium]
MPKILAIDDKQDNLTTLSAILKIYIPDCTIVTAQSGPEGIEKAITELPDTILMDVKMPGMDGYEACKKIKTNKATRHIPIAMITAIKTESADISKGLDIGADVFLAKPIDETVLVAQVNTLLRIKKAEDKLRGQRDLLGTVAKERTDELIKSEKSYKVLLETTSEGFWQFNPELKTIEVNPALCKMLGYSAEEMIGKTPFDFADDENQKIFSEQTSKISTTLHRSYEIVLRKKASIHGV